MQAKYTSFLDEIQSYFTGFPDGKLNDISDYNSLRSLNDYFNAGHVNFHTDRKQLYRLNMLSTNMPQETKRPSWLLLRPQNDTNTLKIATQNTRKDSQSMDYG